MEKEYMTVGELAKQLGITVRTLQYYDREGLLKPSAISEGGRRLYSYKDLIRLQQILSFKSLGFSLDDIRNQILSLDTPEEIAKVLKQQQIIVDERITNLQSASYALSTLCDEVLDMKTVDFKKYAQIIELLKMENKDYWILKFMDDGLTDHIQSRFAKEPEAGERILENYKTMLDQAVILKRSEVSPTSKESIDLAQKWWNMVLDFTGGDMSLLPNLMEFNNSKENWNSDLAQKQQEVEEFISTALGAYFMESGIQFPGTE